MGSAVVITEGIDKYFVWTKAGRFPRYAHDTHEGAVAEAERLAKLTPGKKFIVAHFIEKVSADAEQSIIATAE
jgi:hypothetical protein